MKRKEKEKLKQFKKQDEKKKDKKQDEKKKNKKNTKTRPIENFSFCFQKCPKKLFFEKYFTDEKLILIFFNFSFHLLKIF
jgi:hypothetical protein